MRNLVMAAIGRILIRQSVECGRGAISVKYAAGSVPGQALNGSSFEWLNAAGSRECPQFNGDDEVMVLVGASRDSDSDARRPNVPSWASKSDPQAVL